MHANPGFYDVEDLTNLYHIYETMQNDLNLRFKIEPLFDDDIEGFHDAIDIRFKLTRQMIEQNLSMVTEAQNWPQSDFDDNLDNYTINSIYPIYSSENYSIYRLNLSTGLYQTLLDWFDYQDNAEKYLKSRPYAQFERNNYWYFLAPKDPNKFAQQILDLDEPGANDYFTKFYSTDTKINKRSKKAYQAYEAYQAKSPSNNDDD